ncbi:MAG: hypothetical protein GKS01_16010 [Alphaproteobacteria bacterium]|nr:hypothetical protein [Alphaproteobacteria bacterium]
MKRRVKFIGYGIIVTIVFACVEVLAYIATEYLASKGAVYFPQSIEGFDTYKASRNSNLGWAPNTSDLDASGSRTIPAFPNSTSGCVSIYGDSFIWGHLLSAADSISNRLAERIGCRVANFGVSGYGSDQSYLRYLHNRDDDAPLVILGHLSENILRNVNRYRWLLYPGANFQFKPRFVASQSGKLKLLSMPMPETVLEMQEIIADPARYISHDAFVPGGSSGKVDHAFSSTLTLLRSLAQFQVQAQLRRRPWYTAFYDPTHPSRALATTASIFGAFTNTATARQQNPLVALLPTGLDMTYFRRTGKWPYAPLVEELKRRGIPFIDVGNEIAARIDGKDVCRYFIDCTHHFTAVTTKLVAQIFLERMKTSKIEIKIK